MSPPKKLATGLAVIKVSRYALAKSNSIGIDTKEDFVAIKKIMEYKT